MESREKPPAIPTTNREALNVLLTLDDLVHCIIPRGGEGLIRFVAENSRIPVIKHYKGICNLYVDKDADLDLAETIVEMQSVSAPGFVTLLKIFHTQGRSPKLPSKSSAPLTSQE